MTAFFWWKLCSAQSGAGSRHATAHLFWSWLPRFTACRLEQVPVFEESKSGGDGTDDPESADQVFEHVLEDDIMHGKDEDGERTGEGKGPGSPSGDEAQPTQHETDEHAAEQVADDVDEQIDRHDGVAVEVRPERGKLRNEASLGDVVGQAVYAHERGPGDPANQGERRRDGGKPRRAPHAQR